MRKKLNQYKGVLTAQEIADGMNLAIENARRLQRDAALLLAAGSSATAMALAILSIEESGKCHILRRLAIASTPEMANRAWRIYRSHTDKNIQWTMLHHLKEGTPTKLEDFRPMFDLDAEAPFLLDQIKQLALYTDCLGDRTWTSPLTLDVAFAPTLVQLAEIFSSHDGTITAREIELWIENVAINVPDDDLSSAQEALSKWYAAMQAEGLAPSGPNLMEAFVNQGIMIQRGDRSS